ncbi:MAG: KTSC domain-containing protein [Thermoleophilia bacterium]
MGAEMHPVDSEAVARVGYDGDARELYVEFRSGRTYAYAGVTEETWRRLREAESVGGFVNRVLKPRHAVREVADGG